MKKAETRTTFVGIILAVVLIVFSSIAFEARGGEITDRFKTIIPNVSNTLQIPSEVDQIRYDLENNIFEICVNNQGCEVQENKELEVALTNAYFERNLPAKLTLPQESQYRVNPNIGGIKRFYLQDYFIQRFDKETKAEALISFEYSYDGIKQGNFLLTKQDELFELINPQKLDSRAGALTAITSQNPTIFITTTEDLLREDDKEHLQKIHQKKIPTLYQGTFSSSLTAERLPQELEIGDGYTFKREYVRNQEAKYALHINQEITGISLYLTEERFVSRGEPTYILAGEIRAEKITGDGFEKVESITTPEITIIEQVNEWKNAPLKNPVTLNYEGRTNQYCVEQIRKRYLYVNLAKPQTTCE